jgi:hypothetical protein
MNPDATAPDFYRVRKTQRELATLRTDAQHMIAPAYEALRAVLLSELDWHRRWHFPFDDPMYTPRGTLPKDLLS